MSQTPTQTKQRLVSLDAFRGATIALMILVNTPGDGRYVYAPLQHSEWHGWTATDVVFPSFLWIVGVAMTLSMARGRPQPFTQVLRRAAILFVLGVLVYVYPDFNLGTQRILGVLQRIAICYLIAAAIYRTTGIRGQIAWIAGLLTVYWLLMAFVPVPGYGSGRLDVEGNFAHYVDRLVLGSHNYRQTRTWDPEGIVSTLPAIATALFGIMAGHILRLQRTLAERTTWLFLAGNLLIAAGLICNQWLPINKKLWTSSFSLFMAGLDFVIFAMFLWLVDGLGYQRVVKPLVIMGINAIVVYLASEFLDEALGWIRWQSEGHTITLHRWIFDNLFARLLSPINASMVYGMVYTMAIYLVAYAMYRRKWFVRV
jgi:predicted acyltransferase